ncbi:MAG TPA: protein-disulfide reductase DsbD family protein [Paracoccaceae bacterium]|nr:protein-disulfide reductase DsbD family protein [Paracoccaceae bacterium]
MPTMTRTSFIFAAFCALLGVGSASQAQNLPETLFRAELLPGWQTADGRQMSALHIVLTPGWKTYWRSPGEAGIPPVFDWAGSDNVAAVALHWPRPQVFDLAGYRTLAYPGELILPVEITPARPGEPVTLRLKADIGVCEEICVPVTIELSADLARTDAPDNRITRALDLVPDDSRARGMPAARCSAEPIRDGLRLTADIPLTRAQAGDFAVIELLSREVWVASVHNEATGGRLLQTSDMVPANAKPFALNRQDVRITAFTGGEVIEFRGCKG